VTLKQFHERVWMGLHDLQRQAPHGIDEAKIVVHPATRAMLAMETDAFDWYRAPESGERYRGLALQVDPRIGEDAILVRYEVEA
jgi:hypothetical protein